MAHRPYLGTNMVSTYRLRRQSDESFQHNRTLDITNQLQHYICSCRNKQRLRPHGLFFRVPSPARTHASIAASGSGHTRRQIILFDPIIFMQESPVQQAVIGTMQPIAHMIRRTPHGTSRSVQPGPGWSMKTRRVPSRHCRDSKVNANTITAKHTTSTSPLGRARATSPLMCCH